MRDLTYRSPKTEVQNSPIHGKGLFAKEAIASGEIVAVKGGYILTKQEWTTFERGLGAADIQVSEELFIAPVEQEQRDGSMIYTNHSCDPNIAIQGQIVFVAMRDIAPGEELTHDWATADDQDYEMECKCGSRNCRGIVTGKDWMKKELQERYKGWFCWFLQKKIEALSGENRFYSLDNYIGPVTSDFTIEGRNVLKTIRFNFQAKNEKEPVRVNLARLMAGRR